MKKILMFMAALFLWGSVEGADTEAIKQKVASYVSAFNRKDPKTLADHWSADAKYKNPITGNSVTGRQQIEKEFLSVFPEFQDLTIDAQVDAVEFPENNKSLARGKAIFKKQGQTIGESLFQIAFIKENGQWKVSSVQEVDVLDIVSHFDQLKDLEWLIGEWVDQSETFKVDSSYKWDQYKNFITHSFKISVLGKEDLEGRQIIGWDPAKQEVRSWMFDSDGGFAQGVWKKKGQHWIIESTDTLPDGQLGSQITTITPIDRNSYTVEITGREIGGEILPNIEPVKVIRKGGI